MEKPCFTSQNGSTPVTAVIFDLDGTLLNTEQATKGVLGELLARYGKVADKEKDEKRLGMVQKESAKAVVRDYELPITPEQFSEEYMPLLKEKWLHAEVLPGANRLINHLHKHGFPLAIASNSKTVNVDSKVTNQKGWPDIFSVVLGSDQVKSGKPSPDVFLEAARRMGVDAINCLVVEDTLVGVKAAKAAGMKVVAVPSLQNAADQFSIADSVLHSLLEFHPERWGLPHFEDWVNNALPIKPFHLKGSCSNGFLSLSADTEETALPDQVFGLYFGWVKSEEPKSFKAIANIGWDSDSSTLKRKIKIQILDIDDDHVCNQQVEFLFVGYIRGLNNKNDNFEILEDDKFVARTSLDLPEFQPQTHLHFFSQDS